MNCPICDRRNTTGLKTEMIKSGKYAGWRKKTFRCLDCNKDFEVRIRPPKGGIE